MQVNINSKNIKLPDFLIVGAAKSGTTSLYYYLKQHPQIFMPAQKEPWFFYAVEIDAKVGDISYRTKMVNDLDEYSNLFIRANNTQLLGEASTGYLYLYKETIKNIKKYHPNWKELKIIVIIRDPVERAFSHYLDDVRSSKLNSPFKQVIKRWKLREPSLFNTYIDYGFYYDQIKAYKDNFAQVKIFLFDDLKANPLQLVQDLIEFLGIDTRFIPDTSLKYNISGIPKNKFLGNLVYRPNFIKKIINILLPKEARLKIKNKFFKDLFYTPQLESSSRDFLKEVYKEDVLKLQRLINKDLTKWLK